jgi:hypothetical protein
MGVVTAAMVAATLVMAGDIMVEATVEVTLTMQGATTVAGTAEAGILAAAAAIGMGDWYAYGVGSCWRLTPTGYIWICGY